MRVYYDRDADVNLIKGKRVAIIGYGSQGHAHANNLKESGVKDVVVGLRPKSGGVAKAEAAGLKVMDPADCAKSADVVAFFIGHDDGDQHMPDVETDDGFLGEQVPSRDDEDQARKHSVNFMTI